MYVIRDIFQLKFGLFKEMKQLMVDGVKQNVFPKEDIRILSDFTGQAYRLIFERQFASLADYERDLQSNMSTPEWQDWYAKFKVHVESSFREIMKIQNIS